MSKRTLKPVDLNLDEPGKDLSRMFAASLSGNPDVRQATMLPVERLLDSPYQPRLRIDAASLDDLARVIEGQGFQGVLVARPHPELPGSYQLTAGHRRREAAKRAGLATLPVVVQELSNEEMVTLAITENIQRDDLTPLEEGRMYLLMSEEMGYTLEQMSKEVGKTVGYIYNRLRVAKAPADVQELVQQKPDSLRAVANLIKVEDQVDRAEIIERLLDGRMTTDDIPSYISVLSAERHSHPSPLPRPSSPVEPDGSTERNVIGSATPPAPSSQPATPSTPLTPVDQFHREDTTPLGPRLFTALGDPVVDQPISSGEGLAFREMGGELDTVLVNGVQMPVERKRPLPNLSEGHSLEMGDSAGAVGVGGARGAAERAERARLRARRSRISRVLGLVLAVNDGLHDDESLSEEEKLELATLAVVAERLCYRFGIRKDG